MPAAALKRASNSARPSSVCPFQISVPSKSITMVTISGGTSGGGGLATGMLSRTECVWTGMVMISMMISTSITSISGVVLMSIMTSGSCDPPLTLIAIDSPARSALDRRLGDESDLQDSRELAGEDHAPDEFV